MIPFSESIQPITSKTMATIKNTLALFSGMLALSQLSAQNLIESGDTLTVSLKNVPPADASKFNGQVLVGEKGTIRLAIINQDIKASGLSPERLARAIEKTFVDGQIYTNPTAEVFANASQLAPKTLRVHVGGKVKKEGAIEFQEGMTLQQAIMAAGGFDMFGSERRIFLTRNRKQSTLDLRKAENRLYPLKSGDTIEVDQKKALEP